MKDYNIGLDIGVASVGWAVTDLENNLLKHNGKNMWGARLFSEAQTAKETRTLRCTRRRLDRRKERINMLQELLKDDIEKVDENFLKRIKETSLDFEDKKTSEIVFGKKYNLFSNNKCTDMDYFKAFPTIYDLRLHLLKKKDKADIRLIYLALHHIIKYRGNFLYEGKFNTDSSKINDDIKKVIEWLSLLDINYNDNVDEITNILKNNNLTKMQKRDSIIKLFSYDKSDKKIIVNVINALLGYVFDISALFEIELEQQKLSFKNEIENEENIKESLEEYSEIYEALKSIYSWVTLQNILNGKNLISEAMVCKYEKYKKDLKRLKRVWKKYLPEKYNDMFKKYAQSNYVAYNGKSQGKKYEKCDYQTFINYVIKQIKPFEEDEFVKEILDEIANENFLVKLNTTDNSEIPHQLHQKELEMILENQSKYYDTLKNNKEKIMQLFNFKIPYYVGPLSLNNNYSRFSWIVRNSDEKIRPWNFEEVVNVDETAENFIKRMTNKCTYLTNEDVLAKNSILYSRYCVLNELNNITIDDSHIKRDFKEKIINELFCKKAKVTVQDLKDLYRQYGINIENVMGLSQKDKFLSNMTSYRDMTRIFGKVDESNIKMCEKLIYWITIFEDKKILKRKIKNAYPELEDDKLKMLLKLRYTGWSRLSKKLLCDITDTRGYCIMDMLEKESLNFMQIINSDKYEFKSRLNELSKKEKKSKITIKDINELQTSPANKRAIWQAVCVIAEIVKIMGNNPKNIFIEFARNDEKEKTQKDNRMKKISKIYENIEYQLREEINSDVFSELIKHKDDRTLKDKLYLYFIQGGKCMYTGQNLDIDCLSNYEVDHIIPQSLIKNDSLDNKCLVIKKSNQYKKNNVLSIEVLNLMSNYWKNLYKNGLISQIKYQRLMKREFFSSDADKERFVQRQLVETRQIIKNVTSLLSEVYDDVKIYSLRSILTSQFRVKNGLYKNRNINNYHHAQDAYIMCYIGNVINKKWYNKEQFVYGQHVKSYIEEKAKNDDEKYGILLGLLNKEFQIDSEKIRKIFNYKDCYISSMLTEETGMFYKQTIMSPKENLLPLKEGLDTKKYGGYTGELKAYFVIFEYENNKGQKEYQLIGIPIKVAYDIKNNRTTINNYIKTSFFNNEEQAFKVLKSKVLVGQEYIDENGIKMKLCSDTEVRVNKELLVDQKINRFIYFMNNDSDEEKNNEKLDLNYTEVYEYLLDKMKNEYIIFDTQYKKLINVDLDSLSIEDKKDIINGIIKMLETGQGNLRKAGLSDREGRMSKRNFNTSKLKNMTFINKSVTGMYERRYTIYGLENNCN